MTTRLGWMLIAGVLLLGCNGTTDDDDDDDLAPGEGYDVGDTLPTCTLTNQDGDSVSTHDAEGDRILLTIGAGWCEPCADAADDAEALYAEMSDEFGFTMYETLIQDAGYTDDVSAEELQAWKDDHDLTTLDVWTDGMETCVDPFSTGNLPVFVIVDEELVIRDLIANGYNASVETQVKDALQAW